MLRLRMIYLRVPAVCFLCANPIPPGACTIIKWRIVAPTPEVAGRFGLGHFHNEPCAEAMIVELRHPTP